ncbi:MAG: response regulator [Desulfobacterales bacterium]|nr:MAG: response regulator [Desulfobacterales bacterium]
MDIFSKLRNMKILLIDDDEWIRDSLSIFFEAEGCRIVSVETAEEGLEALRSQDYDIIITDYKLPGMDGIEFLRQIQGSQQNAKKVLITAYKSELVVEEAKKAGVQHLIAKPFTSETIEASLTFLTADL